MTAIDELRRMLDERGVEYKDRDMFGMHVVHWGEPLHGAMFTDGGEWTELVIENASPAQAIAATLGDADATGARHGVDPDPDRVRELLYSCESREELCARVAALEAVVGRVG